jgi:hypothetical protein
LIEAEIPEAMGKELVLQLQKLKLLEAESGSLWHGGFLVFAEVAQGRLKAIALEILGAGRR